MKRDEAKRAIARKAHAYKTVFKSTEGQQVLEDLHQYFGGTTLRKDKEGRIDPHASLARAGCLEVLLYIDQMRKINATTE